ncbi:hypothetical protein BGZ83_006753 [Gryganskiella cystojenkinii]|nr:hypothetical protein BGZ83_006753 [Gryganskiella cystojenkinii]
MEAPLPAGWISQYDANHKRYFYVETASGKTQWEDPRATAAPPPYSAAPSASPATTAPATEKGFGNMLGAAAGAYAHHPQPQPGYGQPAYPPSQYPQHPPPAPGAPYGAAPSPYGVPQQPYYPAQPYPQQPMYAPAPPQAMSYAPPVQHHGMPHVSGGMVAGAGAGALLMGALHHASHGHHQPMHHAQ